MIRRLRALIARLRTPAPPDMWLTSPDTARWTATEGETR